MFFFQRNLRRICILGDKLSLKKVVKSFVNLYDCSLINNFVRFYPILKIKTNLTNEKYESINNLDDLQICLTAHYCVLT